jgi:hypothetical protein
MQVFLVISYEQRRHSIQLHEGSECVSMEWQAISAGARGEKREHSKVRREDSGERREGRAEMGEEAGARPGLGGCGVREEG